jgi:hypothetical protein
MDEYDSKRWRNGNIKKLTAGVYAIAIGIQVDEVADIVAFAYIANYSKRL